MKHWLLGCLCVLVGGVAFAALAAVDRPVVESSMLLTGTIVIAPDGSVRSHTIDQPEKVPSAIRAFADKAMAAWKFVPAVIDGHPGVAQAKVHLRLIADPTADGSYVVRVGGVSFEGDGDSSENLQENVAVSRLHAPQYPFDALRAHTGGTVFLLLRVGRQGEVLDAAAEQVNLTAQGPAWEMAKLRGQFARASLVAVKRWRFVAPTTGQLADKPYWYARVPVTFALRSPGHPPPTDEDEYGQWQPYVRGPREVVPWLNVPQLTAGAVDTTPDGSVLALGQGPKFATPVSGD